MSRAAIELNDAGLALAAGGELLAVSPGYALLGREPLLVGESARARSRVEPLATQNRFWAELSQEALGARIAEGRSNADLAHAHLSELANALRGRADLVVGAVPASMTEVQLALTLGIARACDLPLAGFVDSAVLVAAHLRAPGHFIDVDLQLHQAVLTSVQAGNDIRRGRFEVLAGAGLLALQERWLALIARRFIADTRFDPLHEAENEQALFDALPQWLERLASEPALDIQMAFGEDSHRITLTREELAIEAEPVLDALLAGLRRLRRAGQPATLGLPARVALLPGLLERLAEFSDCEVVSFPDGAPALSAAALDQTWEDRGESVTLLRALPRAAELPAFEFRQLRAAEEITGAAVPTHLLYRGHAHALREEPLIIGLDPGAGANRLQVSGARAGISRRHCSVQLTARGAFLTDHSRYGTWINEEYVAGRAPLRAGDRVRLGTPGVTLDLIAMQ